MSWEQKQGQCQRSSQVAARLCQEPQTLQKLGQTPAPHRQEPFLLEPVWGTMSPPQHFRCFWAWILVPDQVGQSSSTAGELFQTVGYILGWYVHSPGTLLIAAPCVSLSLLSLLISSCLSDGR